MNKTTWHLIALLLIGNLANAQWLYESNASFGGATVRAYSFTGSTATLVNNSMIPGLGNPWKMRMWGSDLILVDNQTNQISEYAVSGPTATLLNSNLTPSANVRYSIGISGNTLFASNWSSSNGVGGTIDIYGLSGTGATFLGNFGVVGQVQDIFVSSNTLFAAYNNGTEHIGEWNISGGAPALVNADLIPGISGQPYVALFQNNLLVGTGGTVAEYSLSGANAVLVNSNLATVPFIDDMVVQGNDLFLSDAATSHTIYEYALSGTTATVVNSALATSVSSGGLVVTPEPSSALLVALGVSALTGRRYRRASSRSLS